MFSVKCGKWLLVFSGKFQITKYGVYGQGFKGDLLVVDIKYAQNVRKACRKCAESLQKVCGKFEESVRKACGKWKLCGKLILLVRF